MRKPRTDYSYTCDNCDAFIKDSPKKFSKAWCWEFRRLVQLRLDGEEWKYMKIADCIVDDLQCGG